MISAGSAAVSAEISAKPGAVLRPPVPPMNSSVPPGRTLATASRATCIGSNEVGFDVAARRVEVELGQRRVVGAGAGDQHVVDRRRGTRRRRPEPFEVRGVEGGEALRADLLPGALEALAIAAGEDHLGAFGAGPSSGLEPDAGAPTDHDDGLPGQLRLPRRSLDACRVHRYHDACGGDLAQSAFSASA